MKRLLTGTLVLAASFSLWNCQKSNKTSTSTTVEGLSPAEAAKAREIIGKDAVSVADMNTIRDYLNGSWESTDCYSVNDKADPKAKSSNMFRMEFKTSDAGSILETSSYKYAQEKCAGEKLHTIATHSTPVTIKNVSTAGVKLDDDLDGFEVYTVVFGATAGSEFQSKTLYALIAIPSYDPGMKIFLMSTPVDDIKKLPLTLSYKNALRYDPKVNK